MEISGPLMNITNILQTIFSFFNNLDKRKISAGQNWIDYKPNRSFDEYHQSPFEEIHYANFDTKEKQGYLDLTKFSK